ncbi:MAG: hypothetical protein ACI4XE_11325 [Acutalibacteraceae bacterium]
MDNKQQRALQEVKNIREKYVSEKKNTEDKITTLRKLDAGTKRSGKIVSSVIGVISVLIFGFGMSFTTVWSEELFVPGIFVGIVGLAGIAAAYPIYMVTTKKQREKVASRVVELADEIIDEQTSIE